MELKSFYICVYIYILFTHYLYFWLGWVFTAVQAFSHCGERGLLFCFGARVPHCGDCLAAELGLQGVWAQCLRLPALTGMLSSGDCLAAELGLQGVWAQCLWLPALAGMLSSCGAAV